MLSNVGFSTFGPEHFVSDRRRATTRDKRPGETVRERRAFDTVRRAEMRYGRQLRSVAEQVGHIIQGLASSRDIPDPALVEQAMRRYAEMLIPWARAVGSAMLADVSRRDEAVWANIAQDMSRSLREEIQTAPTGEAMRHLLEEQVSLITSIPLKAAERVHKLALEARVTGARYDTIVEQIMRSGKVTRSRATLIARTEVARTASGLVQARATHVGSEGYIWRTAEDSDVRKSHRKMAGRYVRWSHPPTTDNLVGHAGQLPNCRCYPEPVIPEQIQ